MPHLPQLCISKSIVLFAMLQQPLLSRALQAQIAMANTALTVLGMWILHIPGIGLLGLFVFICSFIPIAGVFISTAPIAFVALTEYGFLKVGCAVLCYAMLCRAVLCYAVLCCCCAKWLLCRVVAVHYCCCATLLLCSLVT